MIKELNQFLTESRFSHDQAAFRMLNDQSYDYYVGRAIEALRSAQEHSTDTVATIANLKVAAKMCAFAAFRVIYGTIQAKTKKRA